MTPDRYNEEIFKKSLFRNDTHNWPETSDLALTHAMYNNYDIKLHVATFLQDCHTIEARSGL